MKRLLFIGIALSMLSVYSQGVMVISEAQTESIPTFETVMNHWMGAVKTTMNIENARMRVFREQGTRKLHMVQWFDSMKEMVAKMDDQEANRDKIMQTLEGMTPMPEGTWEKFTETTDFKESAVWKYMPELSSTPETFSPLSQDAKDEITYRRVQYMSVDVGQDEAFESWRKKVNQLDKSLGISFHMAVFKNVFGARDADYLVILLDNSRFDYHKNWEARMKKRGESDAWQEVMNNSDNMNKWSVMKESNWNQIVRMSF